MIDPFIFALFASLVFLTFQVARLWSLRRASGAVELLLCSLASDVWCFGYAIEILSPGFSQKLFWAKFQYLGIATVSVWALLFILRYIGRVTRTNFRHIAALLVIPILTIGVAFTNEAHGWLWTTTSLQPGSSTAPLILEHGWWFWVIIGYSYLLLFGATVLLFQHMFGTQRKYRPQLLLMLVALSAPWFGNILYILGLQPGPHLDLTPIAFTVTNIGLAVGFIQFRLLEIRPIAYSSIFGFMQDGVIVLDSQHRIIDINPAARQTLIQLSDSANMLQADPQDSTDPWTGLSMDALLPIWDQAIGNELFFHSISGPEEITRHYSIRATSILDKQGESTGYVIIFVDVTNLHRAEERARLQATALESAKNAIIITNFQGNIEWVNPAFTQLTGYEHEEVLGENPRILKSGKNPAGLYLNMWDTISSGKVWQGEMINRRKDGSEYFEEMTITPLVQPNGTITHFIAIKQDISDRKRAEEALKLAHEQAVESNRMKTQLLAHVSHDMRTPLSAIIGYTEMLQANVYGEIPVEQKNVLTEIQDSANQLLLFVNNLIGQAQFETGKILLKPKYFFVEELVEACRDSVTYSANRKGLQMQYEIDPSLEQAIYGDPYWLRQILLNLANNAVKYTHQGLVKVRLFCPDQQHWTMEVADTGIGISKEAQETVFEPFRQVDGSKTREYGGSGLGLSIVKELTDLMGGQISLVSWPGVGSTFSVSFPYIEKRADQ